jgi:DNA-binding beta-propeller fold protein YncE
MLIPATPPQAVPGSGGFDYVAVDAQRRRVFAAHGGANALLIVDADSGRVIGQVRVGAVAGVAVEPASGHVFTGNGSSNSVSEIDPVAMTVLRSVDTAGPVDAIAYDPSNGHIYADEDDGTRVFVIDAKTFKPIKTIVVPGHKPEYLAIDPQTHDVYQNIDDLGEIAVIDPVTLSVKRTIPTPDVKGNHPLQYDAEYGQIVVAGTNGMMSAYTRAGKKIGSLAVPRFDQCNLDQAQHLLVCAGSGGLTRIQLKRDATPTLVDTTPVNAGAHTVAIDPSTHALFTVWSNRDGSGDFVQKFVAAPAAPPAP